MDTELKPGTVIKPTKDEMCVIEAASDSVQDAVTAFTEASRQLRHCRRNLHTVIQSLYPELGDWHYVYTPGKIIVERYRTDK